MRLKDIVIILSRPSEAGNVGAACRAMKNMGLSSLRLVSPTNMNDEVTRARCVHAEDVWENARYYDSLSEAIADCSIVIGTSRRRGARRKDITLTPKEAALFIKNYGAEEDGDDGAPHPAAIVFGNERTGLETSELSLCTISSHIPANEIFPSLNLSHSVQIYCYELFTALSTVAENETRGAWHVVPRQQIDSLAGSICDSLAGLGFYTHTDRERHEEFFRDIFSRAALNEFEAENMRKIFAKAARLGAKNSA
jgi:tRNA/rRNA methyltransferase/tRNA (cytidine32/uridine32-2'-O)-methyltransferase